MVFEQGIGPGVDMAGTLFLYQDDSLSLSLQHPGHPGGTCAFDLTSNGDSS